MLEADLAREASSVGDVHFILFPDCPNRDEALVTFATFKCESKFQVFCCYSSSFQYFCYYKS